jgi:hypothetical protein
MRIGRDPFCLATVVPFRSARILLYSGVAVLAGIDPRSVCVRSTDRTRGERVLRYTFVCSHYSDVNLISLPPAIRYKGREYVPLHRVPLAAGPFLPPSIDRIEEYIELPPECEFSLGIRSRFVRGRKQFLRNVSAGRIRGDSMTPINVLDGDIAILPTFEFRLCRVWQNRGHRETR